MRVLVAGWIGSTNLGDELVFAGVRRLLGPGPKICAVSLDPAATRLSHGVAAVDHRRLDLVAAAARSADLVVVGGGGIIQDLTSPFNLPYHLSRAWLARLGGTPWVGLALGVGPLTTAAGRAMARTLRGAAAVTVRDEHSRELLSRLGVPSVLGADAAVHLAEVPGEPGEPPTGTPPTDVATAAPGPQPGVQVDASASGGDAIVVALRPWSTRRRRLPVGWGRGQEAPDWFVPAMAAALDEASATSGLPVRFVALQTDRDHELHRAVAGHLTAPHELVVPTRHSVLAELARGRVTIALRYHAGLGAALAGRPAVLIGYTPKVDALAATLEAGAVHLAFERQALERLPQAVATQLASPDAAQAAAAGATRLIRRGQANRDALAPWLS